MPRRGWSGRAQADVCSIGDAWPKYRCSRWLGVWRGKSTMSEAAAGISARLRGSHKWPMHVFGRFSSLVHPARVTLHRATRCCGTVTQPKNHAAEMAKPKKKWLGCPSGGSRVPNLCILFGDRRLLLAKMCPSLRQHSPAVSPFIAVCTGIQSQHASQRGGMT